MMAGKGSVYSIVEGLQQDRDARVDEAKNWINEVNESFEELREDYGMDIAEDYNYELEESMSVSIDEAKTVTFGGKTFPKYGWGIVMAGGSGSGKGYVRSHRIAIDAKVMDVDELKKLYVMAAKAGKFDDKRTYNFKNPEDVGALHQIVKKKGFKDKQEDAFFLTNKEGKLDNIIYDITGDDPKKLGSIGKKLKDMGYKTSIVWVVTNREEAFIRNLKRDRVVPEKIFHTTHNDVAKAVEPFLKSADARYYDEAWLVFGSGDSAKDLTPEQEKELEKMGVVKLEKSGTSFIIPNDVEMRVHRILGPMEPNPDKPENYISYDEFMTDYKGNKAKVKKGEMRIRKDI